MGLRIRPQSQARSSFVQTIGKRFQCMTENDVCRPRMPFDGDDDQPDTGTFEATVCELLRTLFEPGVAPQGTAQTE